MTIAEAAEYLGCNVSHVRALWRLGKIAGRRIGRRVVLLNAESVRSYQPPKQHGGYPRGRPRKPREDA